MNAPCLPLQCGWPATESTQSALRDIGGKRKGRFSAVYWAKRPFVDRQQIGSYAPFRSIVDRPSSDPLHREGRTAAGHLCSRSHRSARQIGELKPLMMAWCCGPTTKPGTQRRLGQPHMPSAGDNWRHPDGATIGSGRDAVGYLEAVVTSAIVRSVSAVLVSGPHADSSDHDHRRNGAAARRARWSRD